MKRQTGRIGDFVPYTRRHSVYANTIRTHGWVPHVLCDAAGCYWNNFKSRDKDGHINAAMSDPAYEEMINMILAGYYGEAIKDVVIDYERYDDIEFHLHRRPPDQAVIARESLRVLNIGDKIADTAGPTVNRDIVETNATQGATTGPRPASWSGVVVRDAAQAASTYAFQFGERDLWKIGHATDVKGRLSEVNKHVPHEVLRERWRIVLQHEWPSEGDAYSMEQHVLKALRDPSSVGERVSCTRRALEVAWTAALAEKS